MTKPTGYIGITGFRTIEEVERVNHHIDGMPFGYIMYGFTASNKRLLDPTSQGGTSPRLLDLKRLTSTVSNHHLPMIHYFSSNTQEQLADEVIALFEYCQLNPERVGLQINALWPLPQQVKKIREAFGPDFEAKWKITLQLPQSALLAGDDQIVHRLSEYEDLIQYALIDPSGGQGLDFEAERAGRLMLNIAGSSKRITPGVAGGFSDANVKDRIAQIKKTTLCGHCSQGQLKDYCIDAQGKLRSNEKVRVAYPKDTPAVENSVLDTSKAAKYIDAALEGFFSD